jgi:cell division protein FtsB
MATAIHPHSSPSLRPETAFGMAVSLMFWLCLLAACLLFALVSLSPKLLVYLQLRSQFDANQRRLVGLEQQADQLERVIDAIKTDAEFSAELTRIEFDAVRPDEEVIPVDMALKLDARAVETPLAESPAVHEWYEPHVKTLASDQRLRMSLLGSATLLIILAFTILQPDQMGRVAVGQHSHDSFWRNIARRYSRQM